MYFIYSSVYKLIFLRTVDFISSVGFLATANAPEPGRSGPVGMRTPPALMVFVILGSLHTRPWQAFEFDTPNPRSLSAVQSLKESCYTPHRFLSPCKLP